MAWSETEICIRIREIAERCAEKASNLKKSTKSFEWYAVFHIETRWANRITEILQTQERFTVIEEKLALHTAAELRQKAREWLAKSAVNRIREDPEPA